MADFTNLTRTATAAVGAILISTACVAAAVGPAASADRDAVYAAVQTPASDQAQQA